MRKQWHAICASKQSLQTPSMLRDAEPEITELGVAKNATSPRAPRAAPFRRCRSRYHTCVLSAYSLRVRAERRDFNIHRIASRRSFCGNAKLADSKRCREARKQDAASSCFLTLRNTICATCIRMLMHCISLEMCRPIRDIQIYVMHRITVVVFPNAVQRSIVTSAQNDIIPVPRGDAPRRIF